MELLSWSDLDEKTRMELLGWSYSDGTTRMARLGRSYSDEGLTEGLLEHECCAWAVRRG